MKRSSGDERAGDAPDTDGARVNRDPPYQIDREHLAAASRSSVYKRTHNENTGVARQEETTIQRSGGNRNWSACIKASIARLLDIEGIRSDPDNYSKTIKTQKVRPSQQTFQERVNQVEAESETHKMYWDTMRDVYASTTTKKMRMTTAMASAATTTPPPTQEISSANHPEHEALETLVMAAATGQFSEQAESTEVLKTKTNTRGEIPKSSMPLQGEAVGTKRHSVAVHDPALVKAVDKLNGKLTELLSQIQAASEATAPEPILASAATIASEATEMRRCEEVSMARILEIEEHREKIMQGLLEYAQRKEKRETEGDSKDSFV